MSKWICFRFGEGIVKSNRLIALSREDKLQDRFHRIDSLNWSRYPICAWVKGMNMPILLHRQIVINKDVSEGILYLISNDIELDKQSIETIYQKRWKFEVFYKSIKLNTGLTKHPLPKQKRHRETIFSCPCLQL